MSKKSHKYWAYYTSELKLKGALITNMKTTIFWHNYGVKKEDQSKEEESTTGHFVPIDIDAKLKAANESKWQFYGNDPITGEPIYITHEQNQAMAKGNFNPYSHGKRRRFYDE